jgi:two-component system sensor histidine kinase SenX3
MISAALVLLVLLVALLTGGAGWLLRGVLVGRGQVGQQARIYEAAVSAERARADAADQRLQAFLDAVPQGAVVYDRVGRPTMANAMGRRFVDARHRDALVELAARELVAAVCQGGRDHARRPVQPAGSPRLVVDVLARRLSGGGAIALLEDTTERRRLEEVRRDFVANISHELRTPIGAIALLTETMAAESDADLLLRLARRLHVEALRVSRTVDDLLLLSRIENNEEAVREPVVVADALSEAAERVASAASERHIELKVDLADPAVRMRGDRRQLVSAVYNLLDNAVKYSDADSLVVLRTLPVNGAGNLAIEVEDRGIGIPARDLDRIFERFYRVDQARSRRTGGTGLGLSIVRHVAENHDGRITARSCEGEGSTFVLTLPAEPGTRPRNDLTCPRRLRDAAS